MSIFITKISTQQYFVDGNSRYFPYLRVVTYRNILSVICIELSGRVDSTVAFQPLGYGFASRQPHFLMFFFSLLLLQCEFNINLMSLLRYFYHFTPYDAQAPSACSALIY